MYCSQCGKKVNENMLFCPFCGSPIVIPEQDDVVQQPAARKETTSTAVKQAEPAAAASKTVSDVSIEEFVPLNIEQELTNPKPAAQNAQPNRDPFSTEDIHPEEPVRLSGRKPDLSTASSKGAPNIPSRKAAKTHVPPVRFDPNNMFLDDNEEAEDDDFEYEYEEPESGSFFVRHIRGFVTLILFAIVAFVILGWAISGSGQLALARADLAWKPSVYAELAYESYQNGNYITAGDYYVKALNRDDVNYDYANSASVSYYMANDFTRAESMAHSAININPKRSEAYELLLRLYPDAAERPEKIKALIQTGYQLTGNASLNYQ